MLTLEEAAKRIRAILLEVFYTDAEKMARIDEVLKLAGY